MGKRKDLSEFDKRQIVMARRLGQSISKTAALVGCSWSAVVSIYQKWSKEGTVVNQRQGHGRPRLIDERGERRVARVVRFNRRAAVAQTAQEVNADSDRNVSEYTVHCSLLRMGLHSRRPVRVPMPCPQQWKKVVWFEGSRFLLHHVDGRVRTSSPHIIHMLIKSGLREDFFHPTSYYPRQFGSRTKPFID
ncbi:hypothetical protein DPX16_13777 [Anabarilius grahami]|uniref:Transposase Tc1-like domain-containing protein n=1 Tax=Anabarilius grahami TaxID=495550 RepID=A0A3N0XTF6_ANAGA|nr:hypothetical protein DPX16_13777 [Anabarilius grahami]